VRKGYDLRKRWASFCNIQGLSSRSYEGTLRIYGDGGRYLRSLSSAASMCSVAIGALVASEVEIGDITGCMLDVE
jgi:hypothetical protein